MQNCKLYTKQLTMEFKDWYFSNPKNRLKEIKEQIITALNPLEPKKAERRLHNLLAQRVYVSHLEKQAIEAIAGHELVFTKLHKQPVK